jgi:DNA-binding NtrC family response regulator
MSPVLTQNPRLNAARLLFVGKGPDEHQALHRLLRDWSIQTARSVEQAKCALDSERPTVVICEEEFADGTWRSLLKAAQKLTSPPPVIVLSLRSDDRLWADVLRQGGFDLLASPLDPHRARHVIQYAAERALAETRPHHQVMRMAAQGY